ncbi:MAG: S-adenosyl-l-methionine hydroxide adenosyltransferase family protein [Candidatus Hodarchaeota archaeon]
MKRRIITLLTDFGLRDPYVSTMKGVILSICPTAEIVDISHQIRKFNINEAAFKLAFTAKYFKPSTIHLVVVDPGVGSSRKSLVVSTKNYFFIGPDNGVLSLAAEQDGIKRIIEITNEDLFLKPVSNTFHGRDIFSPIAAHVANEYPLEKIGPNTKKMIKLDFPQSVVTTDKINGAVLYIDGFGNIVTNINSELLKKLNVSHKTILEIQIKSKFKNIIMCNSYNEVTKEKLLGIIGSSGYLEISANQANAANLFNAEITDKISVKVSKA